MVLYQHVPLSQKLQKCRTPGIPIKFVAAEAGFLPFEPPTFLADIVSASVMYCGVCASDAANSGQWTSPPSRSQLLDRKLSSTCVGQEIVTCIQLGMKQEGGASEKEIEMEGKQELAGLSEVMSTP